MLKKKKTHIQNKSEMIIFASFHCIPWEFWSCVNQIKMYIFILKNNIKNNKIPGNKYKQISERYVQCKIQNYVKIN